MVLYLFIGFCGGVAAAILVPAVFSLGAKVIGWFKSAPAVATAVANVQAAASGTGATGPAK